ncbi:MAG TPA: branched-chain amino acid ABC transporter substrate-binding protein [Methylomirabilota bacterium]
MRRIPILAIMAAALWLGPATSTEGQGDGRTIRIGIGAPLTGGASSFGVEMKQAVELAIEDRNTRGGLRFEAAVADDEGSDAKAQTIARAFCDDPTVLGVVGHVNSNVSITASSVYQACGLPMITPMSSNPAVTERGLPNVFRLTNRDDHKGPGLAGYLYQQRGKRKAVVIDDQTVYGKGLADLFARTFSALGGTVVAHPTVKVGDRDFHALLGALPNDFDVLFYGGIAEAAYVLKQMREMGLNQLFACGDGCWSVKGFIQPAEGAATKGEGVLILSAAPAIGRVPGSRAFAERYAKRFGPIANYAASSYDAARVLLLAIEQAADGKGGSPTRADVLAALRGVRFQGIAYARPVEWDAKGDNTGAVIFVNVVDGDRFREVAEIAQADVPK